MDGCVARHMLAKVPRLASIIPAPVPDADHGRNPAYVIAAPAQLDAGTRVSGISNAEPPRQKGAGPGDPKASR
jgi:hypothetical protein